MTKLLTKEQFFIYRIISFTILAVFTALLIPTGEYESYESMKPGTISNRMVIASEDYEVLRSEKEVNDDRNYVSTKITPFFDFIPQEDYYLFKRFSSLQKDIRKISNEHIVLDELLSKKMQAVNDTSEIKDTKFILKADSIIQIKKNLITEMETEFFNDYRTKFADLKDNNFEKIIKLKSVHNHLKVYNDDYISNILKDEITNSVLNRITINRDGRDITLNLDKVYDKNDIIRALREYTIENATTLNQDSLEQLVQTIGRLVVPNINFNKTRTDSAIQVAIDNVPLAKGLIKKGEIVVDRGIIITQAIYEKLQSIEQIRKERVSEEVSSYFKLGKITVFLGKLAFSFMPYLMIFLVIYNNRKSIFYDTKKTTLLQVLILFQIVLTYSMSHYLPSYSEFLVLLPSTAMLFAIFFDLRVAFVSTTVVSIVISILMSNSYSYLFISLVTGIVSIYSVKKIRDRMKLFKSSLNIFLTYLTIAFSYYFLSIISFEDLQTYISQSFLSSLIAPILTFGILVLFEHAFKYPTDITLLELSDMSRPLLKKLQTEAPGTYHHSIIVGNLAEAAAEAIGGNSLLARVGAYYHDIGKTMKSDYFIENQKTKENKHDKLAPNMSSLILSSHVKEGVRLAQEYKLPQVIIDFIEMHHGTSRMEYFYSKALQDAKESGEKVDENVYRYPGPKPASKETAILMIADVVEAKCRTVENPSADIFNQIINDIINQKFKEGELNNCDLKLNDLKKIKDAMVPVIVGIHHRRIKYPEKKA
ncbi:MAG: HDIG domain-containing protein [Candidatus Delongbacteria bacterium]|nr:HDIG domain-containing protein [Candidatus Delongbacteria bacterium]MBN2836256.1 HDIG domain-containing protein [Candidatus Delongbacteria bacterium]